MRIVVAVALCAILLGCEERRNRITIYLDEPDLEEDWEWYPPALEERDLRAVEIIEPGGEDGA